MSDRTPTAIDAVADEYVDTLAKLSPTFATGAGVPGDERTIDASAPEGRDAIAEATRKSFDVRSTDAQFVRPGKDEFKAVPSESVEARPHGDADDFSKMRFKVVSGK